MPRVAQNMFLAKLNLYVLLVLICAGHQSITAASSEWQNLARFLAGMPVAEDSRFVDLAASKVGLRHQKYMNHLWQKIENQYLEPIDKWKAGINLKAKPGNLAVYPLSGADFVNLYHFYPESTQYLMYALEPPGSIADPGTIDRRGLLSSLRSVQSMMNSIALRNYYVTVKMKKKIRNTYLKGTLPIILVFMARMELLVKNVENVVLDTEGKVQLRGDKKARLNYGTRITFIDEGTEKTLHYLKIRLGRKSGTLETAEGKYFHSLGQMNTLLKSAVYLFHWRGFQTTRDLILTKSDMVIQDDSGIPFRSFNQSIWNIHLFGKFKTPVVLRRIKPYTPTQRDLAKAYTLKSDPLPFDYGYGRMRGRLRSNLQLMIRK